MDETMMLEAKKIGEEAEKFLAMDRTMPSVEEICKIDIESMQREEILLKIVDEDSARKALSMAVQSRKISARIDEAKEVIMRPMLDMQKDIYKFINDLKGSLEMIETNLTKKISSWIDQENNENIFYSINEMEVEDGKLYEKNSWTYEIEEPVIIPREFMKVDESKIKELVKMGLRHIPGVKIYQKKSFAIRVKN